MDAPFSLAGKTVLVTGASSGIGRVGAILMGRHGAQLVLHGRDETRLAQTAADCGGNVAKISHGDLTQPADRARLADDCPALDGLFWSAGASRYQPARMLRESNWSQMAELNLEAPALTTAAFLRAGKIKPGGSLVYMSSMAGHRGARGLAAYAAAKAGLEAWVRILAVEVCRQRIRANAIAAGMIRGPLAEEAASQVAEEGLAGDEARYPLGYGEPDDAAAAALFLLAPASRWMTGVTLILDGGWSIA